MMQGRTIGLLLGAVLCSAVGQLLLKTGAQQQASLVRGSFLLAVVRDVRILAGLAVWSLSTVFWLHVLRTAPLSRAYGVTSLTYVLVLLGSMALLGEQVRRVHVAGTILIVIGIVCLLSGD